MPGHILFTKSRVTSGLKTDAHIRSLHAHFQEGLTAYSGGPFATTKNRQPAFVVNKSCVSQLPIDRSDTHAFPQTNLWLLMCGRPRGQTDITPQLGYAFLRPMESGKKAESGKIMPKKWPIAFLYVVFLDIRST